MSITVWFEGRLTLTDEEVAKVREGLSGPDADTRILSNHDLCCAVQDNVGYSGIVVLDVLEAEEA